MRSSHRDRSNTTSGFTLIEVILVLVVIVIIAGIALPNLSGSYGNAKLRSAASNIERLARYARGMAILREQHLTMVIDTEKRLIYIGAEKEKTSDESDGELDQDILTRLGYIDVEPSEIDIAIEKEVSRSLPEGLNVESVEIEEEVLGHENIFYTFQFYSNGQCDGFEIILNDRKDRSIQIYSDPVSGKVRSQFLD
jgi:prepilin-type N-terminal cleavage/methylation domain-containing protein|tara:strand:+ start:423 stop:1010 length:588 start_codon:yes stop_codon:yes gene_type:complete